jgi:hypothetical protein
MTWPGTGLSFPLILVGHQMLPAESGCNYNHKTEGILNTLGDLQQEMIAIAHCIEVESWVVESAEEALAAAQERRKLLDSNQPVGKVLDQLIKEAEDLVMNGFKPKKKG